MHIRLDVPTALTAVVTIAAVWLFLQLWQIVLVLLVGLMLAGLLNPYVERLERRGLRRGTAVGIVFGVLFLLLGGMLALLLPPLVRQLRELVDHFPEKQAPLVHQLEASKLTAPLASSARSVHLASIAEKGKEYLLTYGPRALELIAYGVTAIFFALYIVLDRDRMRGTLFSLVPRSFHLRLSRVLMNLEIIVGGYIRGQIITCALMAVFAFAVLAVTRVPNALALALFAGLADVLPYVGAILVCAPAFLSALSQGTTTAVIVLVVLLAYQEVESRVIVPRIYGDVLRLPPAMVMVSLLVGGKLLGILGALLALPIAAAIRMIVEETRLDLPGEDADDPELRAKDAEAEAEFEARATGASATQAAAIAADIAGERYSEDAANERDPKAAAMRPVTGGD